MIVISTTELAELLAGGDSYIRTKNGEVKGLAVTTDKNPDAPEIIVVGKGPRIVGNAKLFIKSKNFLIRKDRQPNAEDALKSNLSGVLVKHLP